MNVGQKAGFAVKMGVDQAQEEEVRAEGKAKDKAQRIMKQNKVPGVRWRGRDPQSVMDDLFYFSEDSFTDTREGIGEEKHCY